jgi:hypothetical protein
MLIPHDPNTLNAKKKSCRRKKEQRWRFEE